MQWTSDADGFFMMNVAKHFHISIGSFRLTMKVSHSSSMKAKKQQPRIDSVNQTQPRDNAWKVQPRDDKWQSRYTDREWAEWYAARASPSRNFDDVVPARGRSHRSPSPAGQGSRDARSSRDQAPEPREFHRRQSIDESFETPPGDRRASDASRDHRAPRASASPRDGQPRLNPSRRLAEALASPPSLRPNCALCGRACAHCGIPDPDMSRQHGANRPIVLSEPDQTDSESDDALTEAELAAQLAALKRKRQQRQQKSRRKSSKRSRKEKDAPPRRRRSRDGQ